MKHSPKPHFLFTAHNMTLTELEARIDTGEAALADTIAYVDTHYAFTPTAFQNGETHNAAGANNGSCKLFSFARIHGWNTQRTLAAFGLFYFDHVLKHPEGTDHANIRNFVRFGWDGIRFESEALTPRA